MLLGGYDPEEGPVLYYIDYLGALVKTHSYAYGYGGYVSLSVIDRYRKDGSKLINLLFMFIPQLYSTFMYPAFLS